ncbi:hypothetical protein HBO38_02025 [Pseudomonas veronii]|uniref:Uncharacterized protein n=1 Tax=Pseudomonas veronii TaxID=76761 RepID=A0A7Y1A0Z2_PSEVE|nr:hypothetical protein [Pseudomonas veronii]NMY07228.1 hypothetical protein [Pseudomonas veronii]
MNQMVEPKRTYSLHALVLDRNPELPLDEKEFNDLKQAKVRLNAALALEENYDLLLGNYRELELEAISAAVTDMTSMTHEYEDFFEIRTAINRRFVNLLSATRMYLDQYPQSLKKIGANLEAAKEACSKAYDNFFEYRFMEALRNHVQHEGLAVHGVTMGGRWLPPHEPKQLQFSIVPYASKAALEGSDFKKMVLIECPDKVSLIPAARIHVGGISSVHKKVRDLIAPFVSEARHLVEVAIARHEAEAKKRYSGIAAIATEDGVVLEKVPLFLEWDDVRQKLLNRNHPVENLAKRFVTTQAEGAVNS